MALSARPLGMRDDFAGHAKRTLYAQAGQSLGDMLHVDVRNMLIAAANASNSATSRELVALARAMERNAVSARRTREINERIARLAQDRVLRSYDQIRAKSGGAPSGYRAGDRGKFKRYSGGVLRAALAQRNFYKADRNSLAIINVPTLNRRAKQWRRLNFGAGRLGQMSPESRRYPLRISNLVVAELGLDEGPRPGFFIPTGYFVGPEGAPASPSIGRLGQDAFYVAGRGPHRRAITVRRKATAGIRAEHFLENGVMTIAKELGPAYVRLATEVASEARGKGRGGSIATTNTVKAKAPRLARTVRPVR